MVKMDDTLRMYIILRGDIHMDEGKAISQGGHGYKLLTRNIMQNDSVLADEYFSDGSGTNVTLRAPDEKSMLDLYHQAKDLGLPAIKFEDEGHIHPPHFDGSKILTVIGIGPIRRDQRPSKLKRLNSY